MGSIVVRTPVPDMPNLDVPILMGSLTLTHCVLVMLALEEILSADLGDLKWKEAGLPRG